MAQTQNQTKHEAHKWTHADICTYKYIVFFFSFDGLLPNLPWSLFGTENLNGRGPGQISVVIAILVRSQSPDPGTADPALLMRMVVGRLEKLRVRVILGYQIAMATA